MSSALILAAAVGKGFVFIAGLALLALLLWYVFSDKDRSRRNVGTVLSIGIAIMAGLALLPTTNNKGEKVSALKGGIDIVGGSAYTLEIVPNLDEEGKPLPVSQEAVVSAMQTIEKRLDPSGNKNLLLQQQGTDRIIVEMPGISEEEANEVKKTLETVARLEIREVHPQSASLIPSVKAGTRVPGYELLSGKETNDEGEQITREYLVNRRVIVGGESVQTAFVVGDQKGMVSVKLDEEGGEKMFKHTSGMRPGIDLMATVLDGEVLSAATLRQGALRRNFTIDGMETQAECRKLANGLENPLKNPLKIVEAREVSARLGKATVQQGITAGIAGLVITLIFILLYYRFAGIIALIGLAVNIVILFGTMAMFGFTFTLPGIAGIILTIGVAVDANVLIYERLREEMAAGKSVKASIKTAYEKAFSAIIDANITTLITALILFWRASGTIKGFAITLTIGILASLLTALIISRVLFYWGSDLGFVKKLSFMNLFGNKEFPFMRLRKIAFPISIVILVCSIALMGVRGDKALGIDFLGGSIVKFQMGDSEVTETQINEAISDLELEKLPITQEETTTAGKLISIKSATADVEKIKTEIRKDIPQLANVDASDDTVSATLGKEFLWNSAAALLIGLLAIMLYITVRFEFSFALGAFAALFHDLIIVCGAIGLYSWMTGASEFSLIHVGAILTIAGYSINDTIVVFDRIRETLQTKKGNIEDLMNYAINSTLSRTVLTSITTFFVVLVLFVFGGQALKDFSFAILIGVIVGTYSSIFIASPIVYLWAKRKGDESIREEVIATALRDDQATIVE